jgi:hypothetical protein
VTDDKNLEKQERKRLQVEHSHKKSQRAKILKLADKTSNLRAIAASPPSRSRLALSPLARPGGNVTGVTFLFNVLASKQLEMLRELVRSAHTEELAGAWLAHCCTGCDLN